jgi:S-(hydroxymethyl)glutathione dehydrogenase/alcohol dehydrogenase
MYLDGRLNLDAMVTNTLRLEEINDGFEDMKKGMVARTLISFP